VPVGAGDRADREWEVEPGSRRGWSTGVRIVFRLLFWAIVIWVIVAIIHH
jgi:hypothetical protein